jgi:hypothetical protein
MIQVTKFVFARNGYDSSRLPGETLSDVQQSSAVTTLAEMPLMNHDSCSLKLIDLSRSIPRAH